MRKSSPYAVLLFVLAIALGVGLSARPWRVYREQKMAAERQMSLVRQSERRRAEALTEEARLSSPAGRERLARERGYVRPGERPAPRAAGPSAP